jgi:hypothetical protein
MAYKQSRGSEAEGQELGAAGGIAIHQGAEADLVGDAKAGEAFHHDADHDAEHGGAAVKQFSSLELLHEVQLFGAGIEQLVVGGGVGHGDLLGGVKRNGSAGVSRRYLAAALGD